MREKVVRTIGLSLLVLLALTLVALNGLAWSGMVVDEGATSGKLTTPIAPTNPALAAPVRESMVEEPPSRAISSRKAPEAKRESAIVVLAAKRGDCWVEVRAGSLTGETLYAGMLANGRTLRFTRPRLWLRLGAASNVDIAVNGRLSVVPPGTVELTLPDA
jgi:hypothetical protein